MLAEMPRRWVLWALFLSSYSPLFLLVALRTIGTSDILALGCGVLTFLGLVGTYLFLTTGKKKGTRNYQLAAVENHDSDVAAYTATYLLPFLTVFSGTWQDITSLAVFVVIFGIVYVRSRLIYVNPMLSLLGFRLWRVIPVTPGSKQENNANWPCFLLVRNDEIKADQIVEAWRVTEDLLILKGGKS